MVEARLIAATNKNLSAAVARGEFREDLYHRLNVVSVAMPPLRDRKADILFLAQRFLSKYRSERPTVSGISQEVQAALVAYDWPGNVRELENVILRALVMGGSELIQFADLPASVKAGAGGLGDRVFQADKDKSADSAPQRERQDGTLASCEQQAIIEALETANGNRARAAEILQIGVATLYRKMRRYHIAGHLSSKTS
jgi:two-component system response regulator HydG